MPLLGRGPNAIAADFAKTLQTLVAQADRLVAARAEEPHPDVDETDWPELDSAIAVLLAGPLQPNAAADAAAERAEKERERQDAELVNQCVAGLGGLLRPDMIAAEIDRLPEHLRERAWERARAKNADARQVKEEREASERASRVAR